jgi:hypothetical protein
MLNVVGRRLTEVLEYDRSGQVSVGFVIHAGGLNGLQKNIGPQLTFLSVARYPSLIAGDEGGSYCAQGSHKGKKGDYIVEPVFFSPLELKKLRRPFCLKLIARKAGSRGQIRDFILSSQLTSALADLHLLVHGVSLFCHRSSRVVQPASWSATSGAGRRIGVDKTGPHFIPDVQKNKSVAFFPGFFEHHRCVCCDLIRTFAAPHG